MKNKMIHFADMRETTVDRINVGDTLYIQENITYGWGEKFPYYIPAKVTKISPTGKVVTLVTLNYEYKINTHHGRLPNVYKHDNRMEFHNKIAFLFKDTLNKCRKYDIPVNNSKIASVFYCGSICKIVKLQKGIEDYINAKEGLGEYLK